MAGSVNKVILIGNLGQDPEVKSFQNGGRIANLRIATSENWKDKNTGERKERTEWHNVVLQSDVAMRRLAIRPPFWKLFTSGSAPRLPIRMTLLTLPAMKNPLPS